MKILVTGTAGFVGFHLTNRLLNLGYNVVGIDNINDYYSTELKYDRLKEAGISEKAKNWNEKVQSLNNPNYSFYRMNLENKEEIDKLFQTERFDIVCNLAAQAGVRYSIENPQAYINSNIVGFANILEACRHNNIQHLLYASSSSVYGNSKKMPLSTSDSVDNPISLYAATKKSNELMAHTYSHLFNIPTTGLRFFTVYGPWGRPDMAYFLFTKAILEEKPIKVFNKGDLYRDFTYIDDIVDGIVNMIQKGPEKENAYKVYNIGNSSPVKLIDFIETIEKALKKEANKKYHEMQPGDVYKTFADVSDLIDDFNYSPDTTLEKGIGEFVKWYNSYYK
ncbi:MAG: NAD-dependent epimerase/dehydratase family protein [Draconibacterium sp.]|nr:NAD-dependent epimerase/dehydratase family protein [Draconibacterium sp.]